MRSFVSTRLRCAAGAALISLLAAAAPALAVGQFEIDLNPGPTLAANPDALAAFQRAAEAWESLISSPIRVNINADLVAVNNPFVIGSTSLGPGNPNLDYTPVRDAMAVRSVRPGDAILASLPTSAQLTANVPATGHFDNTTIGVTTANQKALGLTANPLTDTQVDGQIVFNSNFSFDYNEADGVDSDKMDFQTAATHEIGHVLGFLSDTDDYDSDETITDNATTLDLFRFNAAHLPTTATQFALDPRELNPGVPADFADLLHAYPMSTGANHGDGNQASHWQDGFSLRPQPTTPSSSAQRSALWIRR